MSEIGDFIEWAMQGALTSARRFKKLNQPINATKTFSDVEAMGGIVMLLRRQRFLELDLNDVKKIKSMMGVAHDEMLETYRGVKKATGLSGSRRLKRADEPDGAFSIWEFFDRLVPMPLGDEE